MNDKHGGRTPTTEEMALWQDATRHDRAFPGRRLPECAPKPEKKALLPIHPPRAKPAFRPPVSQPLRQGDYAGVVDGGTARRMKRGRLPIEAILDLHGLNSARARPALEDFIAGSAAAGKRLVLVITGKGRKTEGGGVIRSLLPEWLAADPTGRHVLAFDAAQPCHGGGGAFYVLLRRAKDRKA